MLSIVLMVLKVIGILLLAILGLLLTVILIILFVPIRYSAKGSYIGKPKGTAQVTWLLHILSAKAVYDEDLDLSVRVFGWKVYPGKEDEETEAEASETKSNEVENQNIEKQKAETPETKTEKPEEKAVEQESVEIEFQNTDRTVAEEADTGRTDTDRTGADRIPTDRITAENLKQSQSKIENSEESVRSKSPKKHRPGILDRLKNFWKSICKKIKHFWKKIKSLLHSIRDKKEAWTTFWDDEKNKNACKLLFGQVKKLLKHLLPRKIQGRVMFGFDDPYTTGQVLSYASIFYGIYHKQLKLQPVFDREVVEAEGTLKGKIRIGTIIWIILRVVVDKQCRKLYKDFRAWQRERE